MRPSVSDIGKMVIDNRQQTKSHRTEKSAYLKPIAR